MKSAWIQIPDFKTFRHVVPRGEVVNIVHSDVKRINLVLCGGGNKILGVCTGRF